jgi:phage repressor protein C with HTH and peptisase S24 domain
LVISQSGDNTDLDKNDPADDSSLMARPEKRPKNPTGLYFARTAKSMTRPELASKSRQNIQTIARLEDGSMELTRAWAEKFSKALGYEAERILFWDKAKRRHIESSEVLPTEPEPSEAAAELRSGAIPEIDTRGGMGGGGVPASEVVRQGHYADPIKPEGWSFPSSFLRDELRVPAARVFVLESGGDSMEPTISSGTRLVVDRGHTVPSPDGIYALRDPFGGIIVKRLQVIRSEPPKVKIISDNPNHPEQEILLSDLELVGKVLIGLRRF